MISIVKCLLAREVATDAITNKVPPHPTHNQPKFVKTQQSPRANTYLQGKIVQSLSNKHPSVCSSAAFLHLHGNLTKCTVLEARLEQANLLKKVLRPCAPFSPAPVQLYTNCQRRWLMPSRTLSKTATSIAMIPESRYKPWTTPM